MVIIQHQNQQQVKGSPSGYIEAKKGDLEDVTGVYQCQSFAQVQYL